MMKALVKTEKGIGNMILTERPIPDYQEDEVLIKVVYGGICGTDLHILNDQYPYWPPVIIGHEFSGIVEQVGSKVTDYHKGDAVVGEPHNLACGKCYLCRNGKIQLCASKRSIGWGIDGAFADYVVMPEKLLHKIPEGVSMREAAMAEPCAIVAHQLLERTKVTPGDYVVVMGMGPIALIAAQMAKIAGAGRVVMTGCESDVAVRLKAAESTGCCDRFINVQTEDTSAIVMKETDNRGADLVVEASGAGPAIGNAIHILKKTGKLCAIGMTNKEKVEVPWNEAMHKALDVFFNMSSSYNGWEMTLSLLKAHQLNLLPLSEVRPIEKWQDAFDDLFAGKAIKILLSMDGSEEK